MRLVLKGLFTVAYIAFFYWLIFGVLVFKVDQPAPSTLAYDASLLNTPAEEVSYAYLLEDRKEALDIRLAVIAAAEHSIDVSYYAIHDGLARDIFYGSLIVAADRGVSVRVIIDGFVEGRYISDFSITELMIHHENIEVKYFEIPTLLQPHTIQNRLHDKLIIIDDVYGITGGRNIGDRYYLDLEDPADMTFDRDLLIFGAQAHSAVIAMKAYYDGLFNHDYSQFAQTTKPENLRDKQLDLVNSYTKYKENLDLDALIMHVHADAYAVERITFLHSPLNRMQKQPVIFETLVELSQAYEEFFIQTPYLILSKPMIDMLASVNYDSITMLTNSLYINPNLVAVSGYARYRDDLAAKTTLYEYQGAGSLHAKTILMGHDITVIGSLNIDPRSFNLSTESVLIVYSDSFNDHVRQTMMTYVSESLEVADDGRMIDREGIVAVDESVTRRMMRRIVGILTYFFDEML